MAGGYPNPSTEPLGVFADQLKDIFRRLTILESPTGTSLSSLVDQVQVALANLASQVTVLVNQAIAANSYTKAQIDSKIANPGTIAPVNVNASGRVTSAGAPLTSIPSRNYNVTTSYVAAWINSDGQLGTSQSTRRVKRDLTPMADEQVAEAILSLVPQWGRFIWDDDDAGLKAFLIAEDVDDLGLFAEDVVTRDEEGRPNSINYSQLVPALVATVRALDARLRAQEGK